MEYFMPLKTMAYTYANHNIGGFKTMQKGNEMLAKSVDSNIRPMGFNLHEGGSQVGALNAPFLCRLRALCTLLEF